MLKELTKLKRKQLFLQLLTPDESTGYIDGATDYSLLIPFSASQKTSREGKYWLAFLYSLSYSCTTAIRMFLEFPSIDNLSSKDFNLYWKNNKETLWFNPDRKYLKNMNQVGSAIGNLKKLSKAHGGFENYISQMLEQGFDSAYTEIKSKWKFFGPMGAYLFFDAVYGLCPEEYSDPSNLDWNHSGKTVVQGMAHLLCDEKAIETKEFDLNRYNKAVDKLAELSSQPKVIIESTLCLFRKLFKCTRYVGYYADRQLVECNAVADLIKHTYNIDIWKYRELSVKDELRGEIHGWSGIRKELLTKFVNTGEI